MNIDKYKPLNVLVVGAGMYVCGRGTNGFGTVLPALYEAKKRNLLGSIRIAATSPSSIQKLKEKIDGLNRLLGVSMPIDCFPRNEKKDAYAYQKAIKDDWMPDCAVVVVPDHLHFETTSYLINKGIHCLVVKPLAPTSDEVKKLIQLVDLKGVYGAVEFHKRFDRSNLKLRDVILQDLVGDPLYFVVEYSQRKSIALERFKEWVYHTNIFQYLGIHYLDIIYFATRAVPLRVMAMGQKQFLVSQGIDTHDSIQCMTEWEMHNGSRFVSTIFTNWIDPEQTSAMSDQKIKVIGTKGRYEADQKRRGIQMVTDKDGIQEPNPDFSDCYGTPGQNDFSFQGYGIESIQQFLKDVRRIMDGELTPSDLERKRPTFREALVPTIILEAANESLDKGGVWINIPQSIRGEGQEK